MRTISLLAAVSLTALLAGQAQAQSRRGFEIGVEGYRYDYEEEFEGVQIVQDEGRLFGLSASYGRALGSWDFQVSGRAAGGEVDYQSSEGDRLDNVVQATVQLELTAGRPVQLSPTVTLTPFVGLGARGHGDSSGGLTTDTGLSGYDRYLSYAYAPLGVAADVRTGPRTSLSVTGQYNLFLGGDSLSEFSRLEPGVPDIELELEDGSGWALAAAFNWSMARGSVSVGPFLRVWDIDQSRSAIIQDEGFAIEFFEPPSRTTEAGLKLAYRF